jgi:predicted enzyme related to lactoylglutathione lyase
MFSEYRILIFSENPDQLMPFYRDALELELERKLDIPNDYGYMFKATDTCKIWLGKHSGVHGKNTEPFRHIINLYTDDVEGWYQKVQKHPEVTIVLPPELTPTSTPEHPRYVCTFLDPEGNCLQFMS